MELKEIGSVQAHDERVWDISVHACLPLLASCSSDKTCKLFDIGEDGQLNEVSELNEETHTKSVRSVQFKYSEVKEYPTLAMGSFDSTSSIWGADDLKSKWELLAVIEGHENEVKCVGWSRDGKYLATCARDKSIWVWETDSLNEEFECVAVLSEHEEDVKFVVWGDDHCFVSGGYDDTLRVWRQDGYDEDEWQCVCVLNMGCTVWSCAWVDATTLVAGLDDGRVVLIVNGSKVEGSQSDLPNSVRDVEEWSVGKVVHVHGGAVYSVAHAVSGGAPGGGAVVASGGADGTVAVHNLKWDTLCVQRAAHGGMEINSVEIVEKSGMGNGLRVATAGDDGKIKMWAVE